MSRALIALLGGLLLLLIVEAVRQAAKPRPVALQTQSQTPPAEAAAPSIQRPTASWFRDITEDVQVDFTHSVGPLGSYFMPEINGSGGAWLDYDRDGDLDLFLVNLGPSPRGPLEGPVTAADRSHRLYRQEDDGRFTDQTTACGLTALAAAQPAAVLGIGCAMGDVNNDGWPDLYLSNYGADQLLLNREGQRFEDVTAATGLGCQEWGSAAAFVDYDRDGWLDLMVVNYCADPLHGHSIACGAGQQDVSYCGPHRFQKTVDRLYRNAGSTQPQSTPLPAPESQSPESLLTIPQFTDVTAAAGLEQTTTYGLGLAVCDFDGDAWPDLFVASDMTANCLWMNQRDGTFREEAIPRGVAASGYGLPQGCMGVALGDIDQDGDFDMLVTNLVTEGSTLYLNDGAGVFEDVTQAYGILRPTRSHTGWGCALIDLDLDGDLDLPIVNGFVVPNGSMFPPHGEDVFQEAVQEVQNAARFFEPYGDVNLLLLNNGRGRFIDETINAGDFTAARGSARALLVADWDNDGDIDLLTTHVGAPARVYRNEFPAQGNWLKVTCWLSEWNREALGAVVRVHSADRSWTALAAPCSSYLSGSASEVHFGLGKLEAIETLEVLWPDGTRETFPAVPTNQHLQLFSGTGTPLPASP